MSIKRGEIYYADLSPVVGAEEGGMRPVLVISNDMINRFSPTVVVAALSSRVTALTPTRVSLLAGDFGVAKDSLILLEQMRAIDKRRLKEAVGKLDAQTMAKVNAAIRACLDLDEK